MNLTFANPWMLAALAAVGLPVLIHYLTRARPRPVVFPPFKFLVEACAGQQSLHRLRTILLLTLRGLAVLALVLTFARPSLSSRPAGGAGSQTRAVLVVDASASMRAVQNGVSLFARAQSDAAEVLRNLDPSAEAAVILAGATPRPLLPALSKNVSALHDALVKVEPTFEAGDPGAALALAQKLLGGSGTIYVFSDFQRENWNSVTEWPAGIETRVRSALEGTLNNTAITGTRLSPGSPVVGEAVEVLCTVFNSSPRPRQQIVRLALGDLEQTAQVLVPPFSSADAAFRVSFPQPGLFSGKAALEADALPEDDTRHIALRVHKSMRLLVLSDSEVDDYRSAAFFVSRAFVPSPQASPGLALVRRHGQDADRGVLETADAFVIIAPTALSGEALEIIARRVKEGAQLLVFLDGANASTLLAPSLSPPFQVVRAVKTAEGEPLVPGTRKLFAMAQEADWANVRVHRRFQTQAMPGRDEETLLRYTDRSAALTLSSVGKGSVVFVNLPLTPDGTDLIGHPLFPSLMHELLRTLRRGEETREATPGFTWTLEAIAAGEANLTVFDPSGQVVPAQVVSSGRTTRLALPPAQRAGLYTARQAETIVGSAAINIDPRESDTRPAALEQIRPGAGASVAMVRDDGELSLAGDSRPLWPQCAAAALLFFYGEMLLLALWRQRRALKSTTEAPA